ncbi:MAG: hypothetical protein WC133_04610 [Candidatus Omnitrophota bacterium]
MKTSTISTIVILVLILAAAAAGIFFFHARPAPEQVFRANLTDAQKVLVMLRRAETAYQQSTQEYKYVSAKRSDGKMIYSEGWNSMKLPNVEASVGFDYECRPADGACQAMEAGNGIRIDIETGAYACLGSYKPVTTEGFDGTFVIVACQA